MKSKKQQSSSTIQTGPHAGSKKRFWQKKAETEHSPPAFQHWQHDRALGLPSDGEQLVLSGRAMALCYGDNSLEYHVEKLLTGLHEIAGQ